MDYDSLEPATVDETVTVEESLANLGLKSEKEVAEEEQAEIDQSEKDVAKAASDLFKNNAEEVQEVEEHEETTEDTTSDEEEHDGEETEEEEASEGDRGESTELQESFSEDGLDLVIDGEIYSVSKDAKLSVKVDGELQEISLQDFANGISGEKAIAQRFSAIAAEKKALTNRVNSINETEQRFRNHMENGEYVQGLNALFEQTGYNTEVFMQGFLTQIEPVVEKYVKMTPAQKQQYLTQVQYERDKLNYEKQLKDSQYKAAEKDQLLRIRQVQSVHNLNDAQFADLAHQLETEMENGTLTKQALTPELVGNYHRLITRETWASEALGKVAPDYKDNQQAQSLIVQAINQLEQQGYNIGPDDVVDIVNRAYGAESKIDQAKKVKKTLTKKETASPSNKHGKNTVNKGNQKGNSGNKGGMLGSLLDQLDDSDDATNLLDTMSKDINF